MKQGSQGHLNPAGFVESRRDRGRKARQPALISRHVTQNSSLQRSVYQTQGNVPTDGRELWL